MITLTIWALERMRTWFSLLLFKPWRVHFEVCFAVLGEIMVVLALMWSIILDVFWTLDSTCIGIMSPLPAIFVLGDTWVYICSSDSNDVSSYIKTSVNQHFIVFSTLSVLDINPNDCYVRPGRSLDVSDRSLKIWLAIWPNRSVSTLHKI